MNSEAPENLDELPAEDQEIAYGGRLRSDQDLVDILKPKDSFQPWHHPVKQIVRDRQWAALTRRLIEAQPQGSRRLRYFTLPGPDLLDVRVLAKVCEPLGVKVEYFGFDAAQRSVHASDGSQRVGEWINAESALRQAGRIASDALILPDRLEDIVLRDSQAYAELSRRPAFDVINIDACDHLAYVPSGRIHNTFNAIEALLKHQMISKTPWLLFLTTRVQPNCLGDPGIKLQHAITSNVTLSQDFGDALASALGADRGKLATSLNAAWSNHDTSFLKLYSIGLGKFLLQFFHAQPNHPANVELASCYSYRVHTEEPDMLALAFRITPGEQRVFSPGTGAATLTENLEPARAIRVATRAEKLQDLDRALQDDLTLRCEAVSGTEALLAAANYNMAAWKEWVSKHKSRPLDLNP